MPQKFKIDLILTDGDLAEFRDLMLDRSIRIDDGVVWLEARGLKASRGAVANWRKSMVRRSMLDVSAIIGPADETAIRAKIADVAAGLDGPDLHQLATFAVFLANLKRASGRVRRRAKPDAAAAVAGDPAGPARQASGEAAMGGNLA
jgi:hypothetical protein